MLADRAHLPAAFDHLSDIAAALAPAPIALLDFDGTLAPIVPDRTQAEMAPSMRAAVEDLARALPVAVISGRDLDDLLLRADLPGVIAIGSHGYRMRALDGTRRDLAGGPALRGDLDAAEGDLRAVVARHPGVEIERKSHALTVHYRQAPDVAEDALRTAMAEIAEASGQLKLMAGKKIFELVPVLDWHKGKAVETLLAERAAHGDGRTPLFIGDDTTDEDALKVIQADGVGIVVGADGPARTHAHYALADLAAVERLLRHLAAHFAQ